MLRDEALRAVQDPAVPPPVLAQVAAEYPDLRPQVAAHPGAYPGLLSWLAAWRDPAVDAALSARAGALGGQAAPVDAGVPAQGPQAAPQFASPYAPQAPGGHVPPQGAQPHTSPGASHQPLVAEAHHGGPGQGAPLADGGHPGVAGYGVGPQVVAVARPRTPAQQRARIAILAVLVAMVLLLVGVAIFLAVKTGTPSAAPAGQGPASSSEAPKDPAEPRVPENTSPGHGVLAGAGDEAAPVTVEVYVDYMCPICGQFEDINGESLAALRDAGNVRVVFHPVAILDRYSQGSQYSTRAASAAAFVADRAPDSFQDFHAGLLANQPHEGSAGLSDEEIAEVARTAGVPANVVADLADGAAVEFAPWVAAATETSTSDPRLQGPQGFGTPTIVIDGERWTGNWTDAQALTQAIKGTSV